MLQLETPRNERNTMQTKNYLTVQTSTPAAPGASHRLGFAGVWLLTLLALGLAGCQTSPFATNTGSATASITVARPLPAVALATDTVFLKHGFTGGRTSPNEFTFTHAGNRGPQSAHAGSLEKFDERVVVTLKPYGDTVTVTCDAKWVENPNETGVRTGPKVWGADAKTYQDLLDEIEARLK